MPSKFREKNNIQIIFRNRNKLMTHWYAKNCCKNSRQEFHSENVPLITKVELMILKYFSEHLYDSMNNGVNVNFWQILYNYKKVNFNWIFSTFNCSLDEDIANILISKTTFSVIFYLKFKTKFINARIDAELINNANSFAWI